MPALPKNKITRVERGKRRVGNASKLKRNPSVMKPQLHKRGFVAMMLKSLGLGKSS